MRERRSLGGHKSQERIDVTSRRIARRSIVAGAFALATLVFPASALAHSAEGTVSCTGSNVHYFNFRPGANAVNWKVTVDGAPFLQGTFVLNEQNGRSGTVHIPYTLTGTHTVSAFAWWPRTFDNSTRPESAPPVATRRVTCAAPPPPSVTPPPVTPPPVTPPPVTTTATPPPAAATAPVSASAGGVLGTRTRSAAARLRVPRSCASRVVRVRVSGRLIRRVTLSINGRRVRTVRLRSTQRSVTVRVPLSRAGASRQTVRARFTFRNGTRSRTLTARATRCGQGAVQPQFTG
jgi:hypothetical protein